MRRSSARRARRNERCARRGDPPAFPSFGNPLCALESIREQPFCEPIDQVHPVGVRFSGVWLDVDQSKEATLFRSLKRLPGIAGVSSNEDALKNLRDTIRSNMMRIIVFNVGFAIVIAFGVVYNAARISLSEHSRDFAGLRVLGFSRSEVSSILMHELAAITVLSIPLGLAVGTGLSRLTLELLRNELYRVPFVIDPSTYGFSVTVVVIAALVSSAIVSRRVSRLDLVEALKTRE